MTLLPPLDDFLDSLVECCPTCGSDAPAVRNVVAPLGNGGEYECDNKWHEEVRDES